MTAIRGCAGLVSSGWSGATGTASGRLVCKTMALLVATGALLRVLGLG